MEPPHLPMAGKGRSVAEPSDLLQAGLAVEMLPPKMYRKTKVTLLSPGPAGGHLTFGRVT